MAGLIVYAVALGLAWVSAAVSVALCGLMALYYAFDQASVRERGSGEQQPSRRPA
jgi:hypothetical protein